MKKNNQELNKYYSKFNEHERLSDQWGELEFLRSKLIIEKYIPDPPATVYDIGGATGKYSLWLSKKGYEVHLIDPVQRHIEQAKKLSLNLSSFKSCSKGDARNLDLPDQIADIVLFMGPLYHLKKKDDRIIALKEARRILKRDGIIFAVGISQFVSTFDGFLSNYIKDKVFREIMLEDLETGQHHNPTLNPAYFTDTYFHHPDKLKQEIKESGFEVISMESIEGIGYIMQDFNNMWEKKKYRDFLLRVLDKTGRDPSLIGASPHIMCIAKKI